MDTTLPSIHQDIDIIDSEDDVDELDVGFCDDLTLLVASEIPHQAELRLEKKLEVFIDFLDVRCMAVAAHKVKTMCLDFNKRDYIPTVRLNGKPIEVVLKHRFLGVHYDKDMEFIAHFDFMVAILNQHIKAMAKLRASKWGPTIATMKVLHHSYIESRLRDGILA